MAYKPLKYPIHPSMKSWKDYCRCNHSQVNLQMAVLMVFLYLSKYLWLTDFFVKMNVGIGYDRCYSLIDYFNPFK